MSIAYTVALCTRNHADRLVRIEAIRKRGQGSRITPKPFYDQLLRAVLAVWDLYRREGRNSTLRKEMNVVYFAGLIPGWSFGSRLADA